MKCILQSYCNLLVALSFNECKAQLFIKILSNSQSFLAASSQLTCSLFAIYLCQTFKLQLSCRMTALSQPNLVSHSVVVQLNSSSTLIFAALQVLYGLCERKTFKLCERKLLSCVREKHLSRVREKF